MTIQNPEYDKKLVETSSWMIRPCLLYKTEYNECMSLRGRFVQYYTEGELSDCSEWYKDHENCSKWLKHGVPSVGARIIENEKNRIKKRLTAHIENDVWERRNDRPPPNWNSPLLKHLEERRDDSYIAQHTEELEQPYDKPNSGICVIS